MILKRVLNILFIFFLVSCENTSNNDKSNIASDKFQTPESLYIIAMNKFENDKLQEAIEQFENIQKIYPLSNEAIQSQIMSGFIDYVMLDYDSAILKFTRIINKYPSLKNIDYVFYMKALCYYEQISHEGLDDKYNTLSIKHLNQVINRFPNSDYSKDSYQKKILVKSNIAAKHMDIGRFYQKNRKYTASLNRYKIVVDDFSETKFTPEALFRISEIYFSIGMIEESIKTAAILGHNYPKSEWYELSYNNLSKENQDSILSRSIDKIFNK